jgi:hypothetical protein
MRDTGVKRAGGSNDHRGSTVEDLFGQADRRVFGANFGFCSSVGHAKFLAPLNGEVPERSIGAVSKTVVPLTGDRGFESLPLRQLIIVFKDLDTKSPDLTIITANI